ncbi:hypothetical protein FEM03_02610 [Phragmitibacter flavus]|uniref:Preprotein translocase subunit SecB n=1 Tax=Phragmitibacter flavus TaxID=2576071 RepID=A0A5R8KIV9_9BACT|nr:hypothetical protein [Phragmitibacter flavus]TLD72266.1 hypothetical protein FEM03_02610 [Phragmitibacter flavus]
MNLSPLQLIRYLVPEISCVANEHYDVERSSDLNDNTFKVESQIYPLESKEPKKYTAWSVELDLCQLPDESANIPYQFKVKIVGLFRCSKKKADLTPEVFVRTNGSSILYGIARETLRSITSVGPWGDMLLPTISFYKEPAADKPLIPKKSRERKEKK